MTASPSPDGTKRERLEQRLAETYGRVEDPWAQVENYREVMAYIANHPDAGSTAVARACDQPRSRVREWMKDSMPDAVRALDVAERKGWLDTTFETTGSRGINVFVAWIFSGGSISVDTYVPHFALADELTETIARQAFERVDLRYRLDRAEDAGRATEAVPETHSSIFGRTLVAWGAPTGTKNTDADLELPTYLYDAPRDVRLDFARTYVLNRSTTRDDRPDLPLQIAERRPERYRQRLVEFLRSLVDEEGAVRPSGDSMIYLWPEAADVLFMPPTFGETS